MTGYLHGKTSGLQQLGEDGAVAPKPRGACEVGYFLDGFLFRLQVSLPYAALQTRRGAVLDCKTRRSLWLFWSPPVNGVPWHDVYSGILSTYYQQDVTIRQLRRWERRRKYLGAHEGCVGFRVGTGRFPVVLLSDATSKKLRR